jgi:bifunctional UDP-N-acetylglucosamine pyrophosphorylase / glucosamine-1-phosphate N-acetyltransferase
MSLFGKQQSKPLSALILAGGKGTRMKSDKAKVLHEVLFAPMVHHVLDAVQPLFEKIIVVVGHQGIQVREALRGYPLLFAEQRMQLGTAHAVLAAEEQLRRCGAETVMILCGDTPLIRTTTLSQMLDVHSAAGASLSVMTTVLDDPSHYGRILSDLLGTVVGIVEEKDATPEQKRIREINTGIYCVEIAFLLDSLRKIGTANKQKEFYLTDLVEIAVAAGKPVQRFACPDPGEILGVNSRHELALAHAGMQTRHNQELMTSGVTLLQPASTFIRKNIPIGSDSIIHAGVHLLGSTRIGCNCRVGPYAVLSDTVLADRVEVGAFCHLAGVQIGEGEIIPPRSSIGPEGRGK